MTSHTGHIIRRCGLVIEAGSFAWLLLIRRGILRAPNPEAADPVLAAKLALFAGFVVWLVGTTTVYWPRQGAKPSKSIDDLRL
jgi:hypothetical protein